MPKAPNTEAARKAPKATSSESEARVSEICDIMSAGQWVTHITAGRLASEWGVSVNTVDKLAAEASRRLRFIVSKAPDLRARMIANLEVITSMALNKGRSRDAIEAIKAMAGIVDADERHYEAIEAKAGPVANTTVRVILTDGGRLEDVHEVPGTEGAGGVQQKA